MANESINATPWHYNPNKAFPNSIFAKSDVQENPKHWYHFGCPVYVTDDKIQHVISVHSQLKVEPYLGYLHPLASFRSLALLDLIIGHVHWAPEVVPVLGVLLDVRLCEDEFGEALLGL